MIFESINYSFALQDFAFSLGAGFAVGFFHQLLSLVLYKGRVAPFAKDIITSFVFAVTMFSYVVSFTNYPIIRIYHLIGGLAGFLCFPLRFSTIFHKFSEKIFKFFKNKILCFGKKLSTTICGFVEKIPQKDKKQSDEAKTDHLQSKEDLLYNL